MSKQQQGTTRRVSDSDCAPHYAASLKCESRASSVSNPCIADTNLPSAVLLQACLSRPPPAHPPPLLAAGSPAARPLCPAGLDKHQDKSACVEFFEEYKACKKRQVSARMRSAFAPPPPVILTPALPPRCLLQFEADRQARLDQRKGFFS